jgi:sortase (surface protein transpeptidase)
MNKKRVIALLIAVLTLIPTTSFAKTNSNQASNNAREAVNAAKGNGADQKQQNQEQRDAKKAQIEAFKTEMKAKHEIIKQLRLERIYPKNLPT